MPQRCQQLAPFEAYGLRHRQGDGNPLGGSDKGKGNAGVTTGGLNQFLASLEQPILFCSADHGSTDSALDRICRVTALDLGQHPGVASLDNPLQLNKQRLPDAHTVVGMDPSHTRLKRINKNPRVKGPGVVGE